MNLSLENKNGPVIDVLLSSGSEKIIKQFGTIDPGCGRSLANLSLRSLDLNVIKAFALNKDIPINALAQIGIILEAL